MRASLLIAFATITTGATAGAVLAPTAHARRWFKMTAASGFVALAVAAGGFADRVGTIIVAGLVLSWMGDLLLTLPGTRPFIGGLVSFLLAHVAYTVAFTERGLAGSAGWVALAVGMVMAAVGTSVARRVPAPLRIPVVAYIVAIGTMTAAAIATHLSNADLRIPAGAVLFVVSDLAVARDRFGRPGTDKTWWGLPTYFAGQLLLAWAAGG